MSRGTRASEKRACYWAFFAGFVLACFGIWKGVELSALGVLIGSVTLPLMWYAGNRTALKLKQGEDTNPPTP
jgi:Zn-dependent membrane protease YugP